MKRVDLIRTIEGFGCELVRHGARHDWYRNPVTAVCQPVPRHREIKEPLARRIIRILAETGDDQVDVDEDDTGDGLETER